MSMKLLGMYEFTSGAGLCAPEGSALGVRDRGGRL